MMSNGRFGMGMGAITMGRYAGFNGWFIGGLTGGQPGLVQVVYRWLAWDLMLCPVPITNKAPRG